MILQKHIVNYVKKYSTSSENTKNKTSSTIASRLINPELYIKPNKHVINFGIAALAGCVMYLVYMIATADQNKGKQKTLSQNTRSIRNKWD